MEGGAIKLFDSRSYDKVLIFNFLLYFLWFHNFTTLTLPMLV
jgi:hypothetical protein